ncbi:hypothetical protein AHAS_Ahas05G0071900 [Arachis hypogaea]
MDVIKLDYYSQFKVVLFKCEWFMAEEDDYGLTYVHFNKRCYQDEPFVLASQAHQCFYVKDSYIPQKHYVMKIILRDLFNIGVQLQFDPNIREPHESANSPISLSDIGEVDLIRLGVQPTIVDVTPNKIKPKDKEIVSHDFDSDAKIEMNNEKFQKKKVKDPITNRVIKKSLEDEESTACGANSSKHETRKKGKMPKKELTRVDDEG